MSFFGIRNECSGNAPETYNATTSSSEMVAANSSRKGIWLQNVGTKTVFLGFGSNAAELDKGIRILKNERMIIGASMLPTEAINVIAQSGTQAVLIQEFI